MEKQYIIKTVGKQTENGNTNTIEVMTMGEYYYEPDRQRISYVECDGELKGCKTDVSAFGNDIVETVRDGGYSIQITAENGKRHMCYYETPFGKMVLGVFCRRIENSLNENGGKLRFFYTMDVNSELISENEVEITVKEASN